MRRTRNQRPNTVTLAGWLLADLLLGLAMLFFVLNTKGTACPEAAVTPSLNTIVTPTITLTPERYQTPPPTTITLTLPPPGLIVEPFTFYVDISSISDFFAGNANAIQNFVHQVNNKLGEMKNQRVGLVIIIGYHRQVSIGVNLAETANSLLISQFPNTFSSERTVTKSFWSAPNTNRQSGTLEIEVYFYAQ
jgi:hypothetical protein